MVNIPQFFQVLLPERLQSFDNPSQKKFKVYEPNHQNENHVFFVN
jgi:hypothetical protein